MKEKLGKYIREYSVRDKGKGYPVYSVTNSKGFCQEYFGKNVASENTSNYKVVPKGCFAYNPSRINVGSVACQDKEDFVSVSPIYVIFEVSQEISQDYLMYYLKSNYCMTYIKAYARGAVRNNLKLSQLGEFEIPVPPISEQQRIVAELDLISSIIDKKKAQLIECEQLAHSIFYDMFADILNANPRFRLKDVASYCVGLTYKPSNVSENGTIVLRSSNIQDNSLDFKDIVRVDIDVPENKYVRDGDILMCARNGSARLVGKVARITKLSEKMSYGAFMTTIRSQYNDFLFHFFLSDYFRHQLTTSQTATINQITSKMLDNIKLNIPELDLQQQFAERIEAIEKQKALVQASIAEAETLFNSRMDYYFN